VTSSSTAVRERYSGRIAGVGTTSGIRLVVGSWTHTPQGRFANVMVERPDGYRILLAPSDAARDVISATYDFDEVRLEPVSAVERPSCWEVSSRSPSLRIGFGFVRRRRPWGRWRRSRSANALRS
jgi:hypothetical protein